MWGYMIAWLFKKLSRKLRRVVSWTLKIPSGLKVRLWLCWLNVGSCGVERGWSTDTWCPTWTAKNNGEVHDEFAHHFLLHFCLQNHFTHSKPLSHDSRCSAFDLWCTFCLNLSSYAFAISISFAKIAMSLSYLANREGIHVPDEFLESVAKSSGGNVRKAMLMFEASCVQQSYEMKREIGDF